MKQYSGGLIEDQTTGSYIAEIREGRCTYWATGASAPCISLFKPVWLTGEMPLFSEQEMEKAVSYWMQREKLHRMMIRGVLDKGTYVEERNRLEQVMDNTALAMEMEGADETELSEVMKQLFEMEDEFVCKQIEKGSGSASRVKGGLYYTHYWKKLIQK
jgi:secernin